MEPRLAAAVRQHFEAEVARRLPAFTLCEKTEQENNSSVLYESRLSAGITFFVLLTFAKNRDAFTIEVAFNSEPGFPWKELPGTVKDVASAPVQNKARFRLAKLWGEIKDVWWNLGVEPSAVEKIKRKSYLKEGDITAKLAEVPGTVARAVERLVTHGLPFFDQILKQKSV